MQTIKEKFNDMNAMRKAKNEAKEEENAEKDLAKARMEVAHEVRMAREAEAQMDHHVNKAAQIAAEHERKHPQHRHHDGTADSYSTQDSFGRSPTDTAGGAYSTDPTDEGNAAYAAGRETAGKTASVAAAPTGYSGNITGAAPTQNNVL